MEPRGEHPHRCTAGHRWQHTGAPAAACEIPAYHPVTGDLPFVSPSDCPVCCGRQDLLVRALHEHYCNLCDGDWDHEGICMDSLAANCPWCFPKPDLEPTPGGRRGPHFHFCSECGQNWQHGAGCSAPLRAALPECTGCQRGLVHSTDEWPAEVAPTMLVGPSKTLRERIRPLALPIGLAAGVLLSLPIVFKGYSALRSPTTNESLSLGKPPAADYRPAPAPIAPRATEPTPDAAKPGVAPHPAKSIPPRVTVSPPPAPRAPAPARQGPVVDRRVEPRAPSEPAASPRASIEPTPPPSRSQLVPESAAPAPPILPAQGESGARAASVAVTLPSIPGAPPFGGLTGSSGRDTSLDGHPRRVAR